MKIILQTAEEDSDVRNQQAGDWKFLYDGSILALSRKMSDVRSEIAVAIHEAIEAWLCREAGVSDYAVTSFDALFEKERAAGKHGQFQEAGDDPRAPYREQHARATDVERALCKSIGIEWQQHESNVNALFK